MQKFNKAGFGDKILFTEKDCSQEFILMNISPNCDNVLVEDLGDLPSGVEIKISSHLIPSVCFICLNSSSCLLTNLGISPFLFRSSAHQRSWHFFGLRQNLCQGRVFFNLAPHQSQFNLLGVFFIINKLMRINACQRIGTQ